MARKGRRAKTKVVLKTVSITWNGQNKSPPSVLRWLRIGKHLKGEEKNKLRRNNDDVSGPSENQPTGQI